VTSVLNIVKAHRSRVITRAIAPKTRWRPIENQGLAGDLGRASEQIRERAAGPVT
jgi:hypothetical protein